MKLWEFLHKHKLIMSKAEYRRLTTQGGIKVNNVFIDDIFGEVEVYQGDVVQCCRKVLVVGVNY